MLIRGKKLAHNQIIAEKNRDASSEGKARMAEADKLQAGLQHSISNLAREHNVAGGGAIPEEKLQDWDQNTIPEFAGKPQKSRQNSGGWRRYVLEKGLPLGKGSLKPTFKE